MECLTKKVKGCKLLTILQKNSILDVSQGSEYASGLQELFYHGSKRDTGECWHAELIIVFTPN